MGYHTYVTTFTFR